MATGAQKETKTSSGGAEVHRADSAGLEDDIENRLTACRDMLVGLWAGAQLGLPEESRAIYALGVMVAGLMGREPDDIVDKIAHDFTERGILISRGQILVQLSKKHRLVAVQPTGAFDFLEQAIETNDFEIAASDRLFARGLFFINETISRAFNVLTFYNDRYISTQTRE